MLYILLRAGVIQFVFREFNFRFEEIDATIFNYDRELKELVIFGNKVNMDLVLFSRETKIPCKGWVMLDHMKTPKVEKT